MSRESKKIKLSQCMIVRDEEENIGRALSWAKGIVCEQIVIDTGSTDQTREIARQMGAAVYSFCWEDDFASAKNFAIEKASGDWIAFLDADEYLDSAGKENLKRLMAQIQGRDFEAVSSFLENIGEDGKVTSHGSQIRFFRNRPDIRYRGRIHEQLVSLEGRPLKTAEVGNQIIVFHTGYQKHEKQKKGKDERNKRILLKALEERPDDGGIMGYLGDACLSEGKEKEAWDWYMLAARQIPRHPEKDDQRSAATLVHLLELAQSREEESLIGEWYEEIRERIPFEPDADYVMGLFWAQKERFSQACRCLKEAFEKEKAFGSSRRAMRFKAEYDFARSLYLKCLYRAGDFSEAICQAQAYLKAFPTDLSVLSVLMQSLAQEKDGEGECLEFLGSLYDLRQPVCRLLLYRCAAGSGLEKLAGSIWEILSETEKEALQARKEGGVRGS